MEPEPMEPTSGYRVQRVKFFLTYAQSGDLTFDDILQKIESIGPLDKYLIAREEHKSGHPHFHVYCTYSKKRHFRDCRFADIVKNDKNYHPHDGGRVRDDSAVAKYCTKDGNYVTNYFQIKEDHYKKAFEFNTVEEAMSYMQEKRPRDVALYGHNLERNFQKRLKKNGFEHKYTLENFKKEPLTLEKSEVLIGPPGCGKTKFALAHFKNPLMVNHVDKLKQLGRQHDGIIFDDMSFAHWPSNSVIAIVDNEDEKDINVKHGVVTVPPMKKIFTSNHDVEEFLVPYTFSDEHQQAIRRRINVTKISEKIF